MCDGSIDICNVWIREIGFQCLTCDGSTLPCAGLSSSTFTKYGQEDLARISPTLGEKGGVLWSRLHITLLISPDHREGAGG